MFVENIIRVIIILLLTVKKALFELNSNNDTNKRLIGNGTEYDPSKYPYIVSIDLRKGSCTGSLINQLYVLTAAHCCYGVDMNVVKVYQGSMLHNRDYRHCVEMHVHKDYDPESGIMQGDLTVLKIERPFPNVKKYIRIGGKPADFANNKALKCIEIGFGVQNNDNFIDKKGYMITTNVRHGRTACRSYNVDFIKATWQQLLCSEPTTPKFLKSTCPGDSGGPMICNNLLYGVCSFSYNHEAPEKLICNVSNLQTAHVFVNYFEGWVKDKLKGVEDIFEEKKKEEDKDEKEKEEEKKKEKEKEKDKDKDKEKEDKDKKKKKKKKKKKRKKSSGNSIKPHNIFNKVLTILLYLLYVD